MNILLSIFFVVAIPIFVLGIAAIVMALCERVRVFGNLLESLIDSVSVSDNLEDRR